MRLDLPLAATKVAFPAATIIPLTAALFAVLPFSTDVYLTAMVDLGREFGVAVVGVQRTLISFTLGFGLAHLAIGRIADQFGRRPTALVGLALYLAASALAVAAPTLDALVAARFLQGLAAATGPILCRTIIRDAAPPDQAGRWLAKNGAYLGLAPLTAPLIGALLAALGGWRAAPAFLVVYGAALLVTVWLRLPETRPAARGEAANLPILRALVELLAHRAFVAVAAALASGYGMLLTWLSTSAFLLISEPRPDQTAGLGDLRARLRRLLLGGSHHRRAPVAQPERDDDPAHRWAAAAAGRAGAGCGARRGISPLGGHPGLRRPVLLRLGARPADGDRDRHAPHSPTWPGRLRPGSA